MKKSFILSGVALAFLSSCSSMNDNQSNSTRNENGHESAVLQSSNEARIEVIASHLEAPWAINKLEDTFYITERTGKIAKIKNGEVTRQNVLLTKTLSTASEAGLLGLVLAPDFEQSNQAFAYYTYEKGREQFNRIVLLQLVEDTWHEKLVLVDEIPSGTYHHGGRLKIGPDRKLYATAGDASNPDFAQDVDSLGGKILRINLDGTIPEDNPFPSSYVYSYGHRNPQGIGWAQDGSLYASEHGQSANDEINKIYAGENYGWPIIEGIETQEGLITPLFTSGENITWAPSGMDFYKDELFVAALRGEALLAFHLKTEEVREIVADVGRIRDVWIEQGVLYWITNNTDGRGTPSSKDDQLFQMKL